MDAIVFLQGVKADGYIHIMYEMGWDAEHQHDDLPAPIGPSA